jgi:hypothetical protein
MFETKWKEVTRDLRKLYNEELQDLYSSPNTIGDQRRMKLTGHVARIWEKGNA